MKRVGLYFFVGILIILNVSLISSQLDYLDLSKTKFEFGESSFLNSLLLIIIALVILIMALIALIIIRFLKYKYLV